MRGDSAHIWRHLLHLIQTCSLEHLMSTGDKKKKRRGLSSSMQLLLALPPPPPPILSPPSCSRCCYFPSTEVRETVPFPIKKFPNSLFFSLSRFCLCEVLVRTVPLSSVFMRCFTSASAALGRYQFLCPSLSVFAAASFNGFLCTSSSNKGMLGCRGMGE